MVLRYTLALAALMAPGLAVAQDAPSYFVTSSAMPYQPLPDSVGWASNIYGQVSGPMVDINWYTYSYGYGYKQQPWMIDIPLPDDFNFQLFGTQYTEVWMSSAGGVYGGDPGNPYTNALYDNNESYGKLPRANTPNAFIAPWWDSWVRSNTFSPHQGGLKWTIDGTGADQILKMEWVNMTQGGCVNQNYQRDCRQAADYTFQLWVYSAHSGRDSMMQFFYKTPVVPTNGYMSGDWMGPLDISGTSGLESDDGSFGVTALACTPNCAFADFPGDTMISIGEGPNLQVSSVVGQREGWTGVLYSASGTVVNAGAQDANGFGVRLWASEDTVLDPLVDIPIGTGPSDLFDPAPDPAGLLSAAKAGGTTDFHIVAPLPGDDQLTVTDYYAIVEVNPASDANPGGLIDEDTRADNTRAWGPFLIGPPTADLAIGDMSAPTDGIAPDGSFDVTWTARNIGNLDVSGVDYAIVLSSDDVITASDNVIGGSNTNVPLDIAKLSDLGVTDHIKLPKDIRPGLYRLGIVMDPTNAVPEIDEFNNSAILGQPFLVGGGAIQVVSSTLSPGYLGAPYCERLDAAGGDGTYAWSVPADQASKIPPGLSLREEPFDARAKGLPFETLVCGVPSQNGHFTFTLHVESNGASADGILTMDVTGKPGVLEVVTFQIPDATFQVPYEAKLFASGGTPPYHWTVTEGAPTTGLTVNGDGTVTGTPAKDGPSPFTVQVEDSATAKQTATQKIDLNVTPPGRLTCVQERLPDGPVLGNYDANLLAAGGQKPYVFSNVETRRLATTVGDKGDSMTNAAPPGLVLSETGKVSGTPAEGGTFLWTVKVTDKLTATDTCILAVNFITSSLEVATSGLPAACVGQDYSVQLQAIGGQGSFKTWTVDDNSTLPAGLSLSADGILSGKLGEDVLGGDKSKTFNFTVRVSDAQNAQGVGGIALPVQASCAPPPTPQTKIVKKNCSASGAGIPSWFAVAGLALLALRRRS